MARRTAPKPLRTALIVLGMHRSGTSALAGVLAKMGADLPQDLMPANEANPRGYFESLKFVNLNDALLVSAGSSWDDWQEFNPDWYRSPRKSEYEVRATEVLTQEFGNSSFLVLKDPRICRLVPFWKEVMTQNNIAPLFICTHRHPQEVAASLSRREGWSASRGLLLWLRHVLDAEADSRGARRVFVSYDMLLSDWRQSITRIGEALALHWPINPDIAAPDIEDFLAESMRHFDSSDTECQPDTVVAGWIGEVHAVLDRWALEGETESDHPRLDFIRAALQESSDTLGLLINENRLLGHDSQQQKLEIRNLRQRIAELDTACREAREEAASHAANHAIEQKMRGTVECRIAELEQARETARAEAEARLGEIARVSKILLESQTRADSLREEVERLKQQEREASQKVDELERALCKRNLEVKERFGEIARVSEILLESETRTDFLRQEVERLKQQERQARQRINDLEASTSWKITGPLRRVVTLLRR